MPTFIERLGRKKYVQFDHSELPRVLRIVDLTALGIGSTIGVGIYVLAGQVSKEIAGPAVTVCFLIAAVASLFAGVCYAEFGARVPKAGSAYIYTYVCVGEFVAFVIGWNLILEYVIGTASVATGFSVYVDELANNTISDALRQSMPINVSFLGEYPDFLAFGLAITISFLLAIGVKESSRLNNVFTCINMVIIIFVIVSAFTQADIENWRLNETTLEDICFDPPPEDYGNWGSGGFAPFGFEGIMQGAATCFFGFVGFDVIATTGEEAINPSKSIPISIGLSLLVIFISYFGLSAAITLVIPYCNQNADASLVYLYEYLDWPVAMWFVSIGALFGFTASLFGALFPLPRVIYAMASDGLIFRSLSKINKRFKTPTFATILSGLFAGIMAMLFDLQALVDMMSIGTLMAYTIVAICVMLLRFTDADISEGSSEYTLLKNTFANDEEAEFSNMSKKHKTSSQYKFNDYIRQMLNTRRLQNPTDLTASLVSYATLIFCVLVTLEAMLLVVLGKNIVAGDVGSIITIVIFGVLTIFNVVIIALQPQSKRHLSFKVPFVPWIPALSSFINMYLMCNLSSDTWIRFGVWMAFGFLMYFSYGVWKSTGDKPPPIGTDNPAFHGSALIIPTIQIQPATPCNSQPNTPKTELKEKKKPPISPLVKVEDGDNSVTRSGSNAENGVNGGVTERNVENGGVTGANGENTGVTRSGNNTENGENTGVTEHNVARNTAAIVTVGVVTEAISDANNKTENSVEKRSVTESNIKSNSVTKSNVENNTGTGVNVTGESVTENKIVTQNKVENKSITENNVIKKEEKREEESERVSKGGASLGALFLAKEREKESEKESKASEIVTAKEEKLFGSSANLASQNTNLNQAKNSDSQIVNKDSINDSNSSDNTQNTTNSFDSNSQIVKDIDGDNIGLLTSIGVGLGSDSVDGEMKQGTNETKLGTNETKLEGAGTDLETNETKIEGTETKLEESEAKLLAGTKLGTTESKLEAETGVGTNETKLGTNETKLGTSETGLGFNETKLEAETKLDSSNTEEVTLRKPRPDNLDLSKVNEGGLKSDEGVIRPSSLGAEGSKEGGLQSDEGVTRPLSLGAEGSKDSPLRYSKSVPALSRFANSYGSVPSTPVSKRHPFKQLRRMSSFDDIPPSSPDSPFARHINKFTIIPVQEMKGGKGASGDATQDPMRDSMRDSMLDSEYSDSSAPLTPHSGVVINSDNPRELMNELYSKLYEDEDKGSAKTSEKVLFTVGSGDSIDDYKRSVGRDSKLEPLDTIRERGESKIIHSDDGFVGVASG